VRPRGGLLLQGAGQLYVKSHMRTHVEFTSAAFPAYPGEEDQINPGRYGKRVAEYLASELPKAGFAVRTIGAEDWGWCVELENAAFPLWIGCGNYEERENAFLCFIEPSKPKIRKWLRSIETSSVVERLASALDAMLRGRADVTKIRWWAEDEART